MQKYIIFFLFSFIAACSHLKAPILRVNLADSEIKSEHESMGRKFMISTQGRFSTEAGNKMFELGGNAVDAAVAISFSISVERPQSTSRE